MSINAKVDNQTYVGINTISVGGKTINLEEISSGGESSSMVTGTFTPTSDMSEVTINTGLTNIHGFIIQMENIKLDSGARALAYVSMLPDLDGYSYIGTNGAGTSLASAGINATANTSTDLGISLENGNINITNATAITRGLFVQTLYRWYAW